MHEDKRQSRGLSKKGKEKEAMRIGRKEKVKESWTKAGQSEAKHTGTVLKQ